MYVSSGSESDEPGKRPRTPLNRGFIVEEEPLVFQIAKTDLRALEHVR